MRLLVYHVKGKRKTFKARLIHTAGVAKIFLLKLT